MAQMKPETLRQKIDEAKCELILMDEIEHSVRALKFKDSHFAYGLLATCDAERPKAAARIERWSAMLAERDGVIVVTDGTKLVNRPSDDGTARRGVMVKITARSKSSTE